MSYSLKVQITGTSQDIFNAITTQVMHWWGRTDTAIAGEHDEFTVSFDKTYWKFKITTFQPYSHVTWHCIDAKHVHQGYQDIEEEWIGTSVHWRLEELDQNQVLLHFEHDGLNPSLNCYEICTPAWEMFITQSLKSFIETGKGTPSLS